MTTWWRDVRFGLTIVVGLGLGIFSRLTDLLPTEIKWIGNFGALWLGVAFLLGRTATGLSQGAAQGGMGLCLAAITHYLPLRLASRGLVIAALRFPFPQWIVVGVLAGAVFGAAGAVSGTRSKYAVWAQAWMIAMLLAEGIVLTFFTTRHIVIGDRSALLVAVPLEVTVAVIALFAFSRSDRRNPAQIGIRSLAVLPLALIGLSSIALLIGPRVY